MDDQQKAVEEQDKLNEKEQLRLDLERLEEVRVASVSEEVRNTDVTEVTFSDYV